MHLLPDVEQVTIPDASHEMFLDDREASARAMLEFFGRNQGVGKKDSFPAHKE